MIDLHCHLDGSITVEIAKKLAQLQKIELPAKTDSELLKKLSVPSDCQSLNDFLECFGLPLRLLQTKEGITEAVRLVQEDCKAQGLEYLEIRFAPQKHCVNGLSQEEVILAALEGLKQSSLHTNLILCLMRADINQSENKETIELAQKYLVKDNGVVAIDLAGAEALFKTRDFEKEFLIAKQKNIPFTIHAGEADGPESVWDAIKFGAVRIGHGVRVTEDPSLVDYLAEKQIPLEMCPTSNRCTKAIDDMSLFPLRQLMEKGVKVTINTDDPAICRTNLKGELDFVTNKYGITSSEKKQLLLNAVDAAFCSDEYKNELKEKIYGSED
ncbi:MAG: adenosine deaminase [Treponema sp.]|nr:adenosine deaminase [Treponema sp.]